MVKFEIAAKCIRSAIQFEVYASCSRKLFLLTEKNHCSFFLSFLTKVDPSQLVISLAAIQVTFVNQHLTDVFFFHRF